MKVELDKTQSNIKNLKTTIKGGRVEEEKSELVEDEDNEDSDDEALAAFLEDDSDDDDNEPEQRNPVDEAVTKLRDKISLLKYRLDTGLGSNKDSLAEKAFKLVKANKEGKVPAERTREQLIELLGQENIGFWVIIENILHYENLKKEITA